MTTRLLGVRIIRKDDGAITFRALLEDNGRSHKVNRVVAKGVKLTPSLQKLVAPASK